MISKADFGLYLEVCGPGGQARGQRLGIQDAQREIIVRALAGSLPAIGSPIASIVGLLGPPDGSDIRSLRYDLNVRPDYVYMFRLSQDGSACIGSGYERRIARSLVRLLPQRNDSDAYRAGLIKLGATESELLALLGEPEERTGWWPYETWNYPDSLALDLRLGVTERPDPGL